MKNIQPTYATFELSKLLKEKKFITKCRNYYLKGYDYPFEGVDDEYWGDNRFKNWNADAIGIKPFEGFTSAPEQWQVVEWLRVIHDICLWVKPYADGITYQPHWCYINNKAKENNNTFHLSGNASINGSDYKTPQEAYSAAFDYILKELI